MSGKEETSHRAELQVATEHIIDSIASYFELPPEEVLNDRGEYRNIAIQVMKQWTSVPNKQIGDVFGSLRCDCGDQLERAMEDIENEGKGILLYMRQEGRGIGLDNKILAYGLQDQGKDTVEANEALGFPADLRDYGIGAQILVDLGARKLRILTNNPKKVVGLKGYGLEIVERIPLVVRPNPDNAKYLETKRDKLGHLISKDWILPEKRD